MSTPFPRRDFLRLAGAAALLGCSCRLLAETPALSNPADVPKDSDEVARLKKQLQDQRAGSTRLLIDLHARHGAPLLETIAAFTVAEWKERFEQTAIAGERNLHAVKTELWDKLPPTFQWQVLEQTPQRLRLKVTGCPVAAQMKQANVPPALGHALVCVGDVGIAAGINPKIRFSRTKTLMEGDCCCDHGYELSPDA